MLGRCIPTCSNSLTGILQKCSRYSPTVTPALSLLEPSVNNFISFKQPRNEVNSSVTGVLHRTYSTFISFRYFSTEDNAVSGDAPTHSEEDLSTEDGAVPRDAPTQSEEDISTEDGSVSGDAPTQSEEDISTEDGAVSGDAPTQSEEDISTEDGAVSGNAPTQSEEDLSTEDGAVSSSDIPAQSEEDPTSEEVDEIDLASETRKQLVEEERQRNIEAQEMHMNRIRIRGLPVTYDNEELIAEAVKIFQTMGVSLDSTVIEKMFYLRNGDVLCEFTETKWLYIIFSKIQNLKNSEYSELGINQSFCSAFNTINYNLRVLKREGKIGNRKKYDGKPYVQLLGSKKWKEITHLQDLVELGLLESDS